MAGFLGLFICDDLKIFGASVFPNTTQAHTGNGANLIILRTDKEAEVLTFLWTYFLSWEG